MAGGTPDIRRLTDDVLDDVVRIHIAGMGYTLNAQLGREHLKYLYSIMAADPGCYVGVVLEDGRPTGVVSGSIDAGRFSSKLIAAMPAKRLLRTAFQMLLRPQLIWLWIQGNSIARPVRVGGSEVRAVLTAIVVAPGIQGRGMGRALVAAFESFLSTAGVGAYRLDTQASNQRAARFYRDLGFVEIARRADSIIFVRNVTT
jgi:ribosomal protein S18 acetylase RimI-like enzyme